MQYSIVNYRSVVDASDSRRFDAEFFRPDYLNVQKQLEEISSQKLIDFQVKIKHPKEINRIYVDDGVLFLRAQNVRPLSIDLTTNPVYISEKDAESLRDNALHYKDILITRTGANFGQCAIYLENERAIASSHTFIVKSGTLNPFFTAVFFNTKYGRKLIDKGMYGGLQPEIAPYFLYQIPMPVWEKLQIEIEKTYLQSYDLTQLSEVRYTEAQTLLLSELGLSNWQPKHRQTFVKNYSDTELAGRIDADYFQPFYEEVNDKLQSTGFVFAKDICSIINYGSVPTSPYSEENSGVPYIKGLNLKNLRVDTEKLDYITNINSLPKKVFTKEGDIIVSQMGTVGNCGVVSKEQGNWVFASFTIRMRIDDKSKYHPYFVALYIENIAKPYYLMRNIAQASVRQNTDLPTIKQMPIPKLPFEKQQQISQKIVEALNLRQQSKHLLKCAKRAVEIAIEQDEQTAIDWLENATKEVLN